MRVERAIRSSQARRTVWAILLVLPFLAPRPVAAEQIHVTLDPAQTKVEWTLITTLHTVHGTFKMKSGTISFDPNGGTASGLILMDATSGDSGNHARDKKMHKEILESQRYPEISFTPRHVVGNVMQNRNSTIHVQGIFHIHGSDHDLTLTIPVQINSEQVKASVSFIVPYQDWGMRDPSNFLLHVENKVAVDVLTTGHITEINNTPATH